MTRLVFGYQRVRISTTPDVATRTRRQLAGFAAKQGYTLADIFVDDDENRACGAYTALIKTLQRHDGAAVVVTGLDQFADSVTAQEAMRLRLEREAGAQVLVISAAPGG